MASSDEAFEFPEPPDGLLKPSANSVIALLDEPHQVEAAVQDLVAQGFEGDGIYVLCGPKGAERLDVSGRQHGLRGRVYRLLEWLSDEKGGLFRARDHLAGGGFLVSVPADDGQKATAARVLGSHGGHDMAHFGPNHWEPLGA